jgi:RHS repeat-associated protein
VSWFSSAWHAVTHPGQLVSDGEHLLGQVTDEGAHLVGRGLTDIGLGQVGNVVDGWGDDAAGALDPEMQLGQTDDPAQLIHGDPGAIRGVAAQLHSFSGAFGQTASGLNGIDTSHWTGAAADAFRAKYAPEPGKWRTASSASGDAGGVMGSFAVTPVTQLSQRARAGRASFDQASQDQVDSQFYAIVTDLVGAPAELMAPDGDLAGYQQRTLWGTTMWHPDGASSPLRFPGQYADAETGLHYNHHRYYDPVTGRYLTPDPLGLTPAPNPHTYVTNPCAVADPLGLAPYKISGTRGLSHSFDEHAAQWFGRDAKASTDMSQWEDLVTQTSKSKLSFDWSSGNTETYAHLARIDGKYFVVQFFKNGPRANELATAFVPNNSQIGAMLRAAGVGGG